MKTTAALLMALGLALPAMTLAQDKDNRPPRQGQGPAREAGAGPANGPGAGGPQGEGQRRPTPPLMEALDANHDGVIDDKAQWPAHNYIHLMEQPTIFYAAAFLLAFVGDGHGLNAMIAWAYVGLRIVHSLIQATSNIIRFRFLAFALSTLCMIALSLHALIAVFSIHGA